MENHHHIKEELIELGIHHLPILKMPDLDMPKDYFNEFPDLMLTSIKSDHFITSLPKQLPYHLPDAYFDQFRSLLAEKIHQDNVIDSLPKSMPYEVPELYFQQLPHQIFNELNASKKSLTPLFFSRKLVAKLSLAATLLLFLGIAFKSLMLPTGHVNAHSVEQQLANLSDQEINQYITEHQTEIESSFALENIDESNLDLQKLETEVFNNALNHLSDEDLSNYIF